MHYIQNNKIAVIKNKKINKNPCNFLKILGTYWEGKQHNDLSVWTLNQLASLGFKFSFTT